MLKTKAKKVYLRKWQEFNMPWEWSVEYKEIAKERRQKQSKNIITSKIHYRLSNHLSFFLKMITLEAF